MISLIALIFVVVLAAAGLKAFINDAGIGLRGTRIEQEQGGESARHHETYPVYKIKKLR